MQMIQQIQKHFWLGVAAAFLLTFLFPPWLLIERIGGEGLFGSSLFSDGSTIERRMPLDSSFILTPPQPHLWPQYAEADILNNMGHIKLEVGVDWRRQGLRFLGVLGIAAALFGLLRFGPWTPNGESS